ncbi:hypothetical protein KUTeg_015656 [Tegillarca granosa]|uniref:SGNH hydrolase-type esterase domain-containing protein n=1 Tax=Tegillarca granosa TaxID=220873 RepID=A0ABQ9EVF7_TEGGR|nr:hypothetical protein KUTeg_015656 [Tegillarca granosa]
MSTGLNRIDKRRDIRMPITVDILQKILHSLPFICFSNYEIVTKYQFVSVLRKCLNFANIDTKCYKSHSFRIGAASTCAMLDCPRVVWIVGSSIICHAMTRTIKSTFKKNLQLETNNLSVLWQGKPGMRWEQVFNKIKHLITFIDPPEFLLLHCGGNDIGSSLKSVELIHLILNTIVKIFKLLPKTRLIWSQILPRLEWRNEVNHRALNNVRVRVNRKIANFVLKNNGFYIKYPELIESNTGCFLRIMIQQALQTFLTTNHIVSPPYGESGPWLNMF